ncbi:MAG: hypothetical protein SH847_06195 [Roseiflexaceae bacterium]|nr:hypothetical protein [Roseiflexaceae bacterium]
MSELLPFQLVLSTELSEADREELLTSLRTQAQVEELASKDPTLVALIALITQAGQVADSISKIATLATLIYGWVQAMRKQGKKPSVKVGRSDQQPLDLANVQSEEEVLDWLLQNPPKK